METNYPLRTKPRISYFSRETIIKPSEKPKNKNTFPCILCYRKLKTHQELKNHRVICHRNYLETDNIIHKYYIRNANFFNIYNLQFNPHNDFQINFLAQPIYVNYEKHFCLHKTIPENRFLYNLYLSSLLQYFPSQKYLDPPHYNNDIFILENCITYGKKQLYKTTTDLIKHQILLYIYRLNQLTSNPLPKFLTAKDYPLIKAIIHFCQHYMKNKSKNRPFDIPQELELCFDLDTDVKTQNMQIIRARNFQRPIGIKPRECPVGINMFDKLVLYMIRKMNPRVECLTPSLHYKLGVRDRIAHKKRIKCTQHCNTMLNDINDAFISSTLNTIKTDVFDEIVNMSQRETQQSLSHSSADDPLIDVTYCDCCWRGLTPSKSFPNNLSHKVLCAKSSTFHSPKMVTAKKLIRPKNLVVKTDLDYSTTLTCTNPSVPKLKPLVSPCLAIKRKYTKRHIQNFQHTQNHEKNNTQQVKKYVLNPTHVNSIQEITNNYKNSVPHVLHKSTNINLVDLTDEDNNYKTPTNHEKMLNGNLNCQETIFSFSSSQKRKLDSNTQDSVFKNLSINGTKTESLMRKKFQKLDNEVTHNKNLRPGPMIILYCHICKHYELVSTQDQIKGKISDHSSLFHKDTQLDIKFSQKNDKNGTNILLVECNKS